jgi:hypothetical protein
MAKLSAAQLKALPDSMFGLPETRQYPMPDKEHVIKAIQFFRYCPSKKKPELAKNINRRAKELKMKIKVQPSSAFYKYADKSILKEAYMVQEFHIGQLSPIVPLQPEILKVNFLENKGTEAPMMRLKKLWDDEKKSLDEKNTETLQIATDCANSGVHFSHNLMANFQGIADLNDMLMKSNEFQTIKTPFMEEFMNTPGRVYDTDGATYAALLHADPKDINNIITIVKGIKRKDLLAAAISYVNYNINISDADKKTFNSSLNAITAATASIDPETIAQAATIKEPEYSVPNQDTNNRINFTDDDIFTVRNILDATENDNKIVTIVSNLIKLVHPDSAANLNLWQEVPNELEALLLKEFVNNEAAKGFYQFKYRTIPFNFVKIEHRLYLAKTVADGNNKKFIFLFKVHDSDDDMGYNDDAINYLKGVHREAFRPIHNSIVINKGQGVKLEAADFKDTLHGIQISTNGNVSVIFDFSKTWVEKVDLCNTEIEKNKKDENLVSLKSNMCFLFALLAHIKITYIQNNKDSIDTGSYDYKDAMDALTKGTEIFKNTVRFMGKKDPRFIFTNFFLATKYNEKIQIFQERDHALVQAVQLMYNIIMQ